MRAKGGQTATKSASCFSIRHTRHRSLSGVAAAMLWVLWVLSVPVLWVLTGRLAGRWRPAGVVAVGDRAGRGSQRGEMALKAEGSREGGSDEDVCFICYEASPPPIQSGCACRGPAGLAHPACRVQAALSSRWWFTCQTCEQTFTGAMCIGLANAWWSQVRDRAEEDPERLAAAHNLASSLFDQGKHAEAEEMLREVLAVRLGSGFTRACATFGRMQGK
jgi:hypothetical protein